MKNRNKFLGICGILAGAGILLCAVGFGMGGVVTGVSLGSNGLQVHTFKNNEKENERHYEKGKETLEDFHTMNITLNYAEFKVEVSDHYGIEYKIYEDDDFNFEVKDGCLEVKEGRKDGLGQFNIINFGFDFWDTAYKKPYVTVYVPENTNLDALLLVNDSGNTVMGSLNTKKLTIKADYGNVDIKEMEASDMEITLDSGNLAMENIKAETLEVKDDYGNCELTDVYVKAWAKMELDSGNLTMKKTEITDLDVAAEYGGIDGKELKTDKMTLTLDCGNLRMENAEVKVLNADAEYGDITGKNLQIEEMNLKLDSGNCELEGLSMKKADIKSDYGNVELEVTDSTADYAMELYTDYGNISLDNGKMGERYNRSEGKKAGKYMKINCDSGNIKITGK